MNQNEIKSFFMQKGIFVESSNISLSNRLSHTDLEYVLKILNIWQTFVLNRENLARVAESLVTDLSTLNCCALSGNPYSPCYIGKIVRINEDTLSKDKYTSYDIGADRLRTQFLVSRAGKSPNLPPLFF